MSWLIAVVAGCAIGYVMFKLGWAWGRVARVKEVHDLTLQCNIYRQSMEMYHKALHELQGNP